MQKINISVKDKTLETTNSFRIASGSINDCYVAFHFEPGYGWEDLDITAVFTRTDQRAYKANIIDDMYYAIPTSVLTRPGNIFVGLIGCKNGNTLVTSTTVTLTVERNAMNILESDIYPVDDNSNLDSSAYAQYVALVNDAANRAEIAAKQAESIGAGWYSKAECDERFAKKVSASSSAEGVFDTSNLVEGAIPTLSINAAAALNVVGSISSPAKLNCIDKVRVRMASDSSSTELTYGGFELRRLSDDCFDSLTISAKGAYKEERIYQLKLSDNYGEWVSATTYRVSLVDAPEMDLSRINEVIANIGDCIKAVDDTYIDLLIPPCTTVAQINNIIIWYPLAVKQTLLVSASGINAVPAGAKSLLVFATLDDTEIPATFSITAELNLAAYINSLVTRIAAENLIVKSLSDRLTEIEDTVAKFHSTKALSIPKEVWSFNSGVSSAIVNIKDSFPINLQTINNGIYTSIDFSYVDNDNGYTVSYKGDPLDAVVIYSL